MTPLAHRRLPYAIHLGPFRIGVKQVTPRALAIVLDEEDETPETWSPGGWVSEEWTIYVNRTLPLQTKWEILCHEIAHAAIDCARIVL